MCEGLPGGWRAAPGCRVMFANRPDAKPRPRNASGLIRRFQSRITLAKRPSARVPGNSEEAAYAHNGEATSSSLVRGSGSVDRILNAADVRFRVRSFSNKRRGRRFPTLASRSHPQPCDNTKLLTMRHTFHEMCEGLPRRMSRRASLPSHIREPTRRKARPRNASGLIRRFQITLRNGLRMVISSIAHHPFKTPLRESGILLAPAASGRRRGASRHRRSCSPYGGARRGTRNRFSTYSTRKQRPHPMESRVRPL